MNKRINLLIVDNDEIARRRHAKLLLTERCRVKSVGNGAEALHEMAKASYDLVLLDVSLPGPDGLATLRAIKQDWPETEVVVLTGHPEIETAVAAIRLGAYDYLAKTVRPQDLIEVVNRALVQKEWALRCERIAA